MEYINYKNFGKCAKLSKGGKTMLVTVDVGPRIIFYGYDNGENIFYEDIDDNINRDSDYIKKNLKGKGIWHIYGGHRIWKSPEYEDSYYPDNSPVKVLELSNGTSFVSDTEITTGLQKVMNIYMDDDGNATIDHIFINNGNCPTSKIALWTLSVMDKGAKAEIPLSTKDTGLLANRNLVLWSYTDLNDKRLDIQNDKITLSQRTDTDKAVKIGTYVEKQVKVYIKDMVFTKDFDRKEGDYADFCCNVECYTNKHMLEIESLSNLQSLEIGQSLIHSEHWTLTKVSHNKQ